MSTKSKAAPEAVADFANKQKSERQSRKVADFVEEQLDARGEIISDPEFCNRLQISRRTAHDWREQGKVPFIRLPGTKAIRYHWPTVLSSLLRTQKIITLANERQHPDRSVA